MSPMSIAIVAGVIVLLLLLLKMRKDKAAAAKPASGDRDRVRLKRKAEKSREPKIKEPRARRGRRGPASIEAAVGQTAATAYAEAPPVEEVAADEWLDDLGDEPVEEHVPEPVADEPVAEEAYAPVEEPAPAEASFDEPEPPVAPEPAPAPRAAAPPPVVDWEPQDVVTAPGWPMPGEMDGGWSSGSEAGDEVPTIDASPGDPAPQAAEPEPSWGEETPAEEATWDGDEEFDPAMGWGEPEVASAGVTAAAEVAAAAEAPAAETTDDEQWTAEWTVDQATAQVAAAEAPVVEEPVAVEDAADDWDPASGWDEPGEPAADEAVGLAEPAEAAEPLLSEDIDWAGEWAEPETAATVAEPVSEPVAEAVPDVAAEVDDAAWADAWAAEEPVLAEAETAAAEAPVAVPAAEAVADDGLLDDPAWADAWAEDDTILADEAPAEPEAAPVAPSPVAAAPEPAAEADDWAAAWMEDDLPAAQEPVQEAAPAPAPEPQAEVVDSDRERAEAETAAAIAPELEALAADFMEDEDDHTVTSEQLAALFGAPSAPEPEIVSAPVAEEPAEDVAYEAEPAPVADVAVEEEANDALSRWATLAPAAVAVPAVAEGVAPDGIAARWASLAPQAADVADVVEEPVAELVGPAARWASITPIAATGSAPEVDPEEPRVELSGRFALGGFAIEGGHQVVNGVTFRFAADEAPAGWVLGPCPDAAPGTLVIDVEGVLNCVATDVEVLSNPGFAPTVNGFTLRLSAADSGPFAASGTYHLA